MQYISGIITNILWFFACFIIFYMALIIIMYTGMLMISLFKIRKEYKLEHDTGLAGFIYTKPVSILVPAFNEEAGILDSVRSLLSLNYPQTEIIVINDGSTDSTLEKMLTHFQMVKTNRVVRQDLVTKEVKAIYRSTKISNLILVDKDNGGKADSLNMGINVSRYSHFCAVDGDSILEADSLLKVMRPIIKSNEEVIASGGSVRIANGSEIHLGKIFKVGISKKPLVVMQVIEYLRAFLVGRIGLSHHNMLLIISGAFGAFSKKWVIKAGGYSTNTVGEDMELVIRLHRMIKEEKLDKRIEFVSDPVCWTEVPESMKYLRRQRSRWHRGLLESLWKHRRMTLNPRYGPVGMISIPYYWLIELLGPVVELGGYLFIIYSLIYGGIYLEYAILLFLLFVLYGSVFSMIAVLFEGWSLNRYPKIKDLIRLYIYSFFEIFWYRPITIFWRCAGILDCIFKKRQWGDMERKGLSKL